MIVATAARRERARELTRALDSIQSQASVHATPIVVANGFHVDSDVMFSLRKRRGIRLIEIRQGSYPAALYAGRRRVDTQWYSQLDDDDEFLPDALRQRMELASTEPSCAAVVSNGWTRAANGDSLRLPDIARVRSNPLRALTRGNWLSPGAGLFRTAAVTPDLFRRMPKYLEWTYMAVMLARIGPIRFLEQPTYVYHEDTPAALSRSDAYVLGQPRALRRILDLGPPTEIRAFLDSRLGHAQNICAMRYLERGDIVRAWHWHLRTLKSPHGYRYLPVMRHLLGASARRWLRRDPPHR